MYFQVIPFPPKTLQACVRGFWAERNGATSKAYDIKNVELIT